MTNRCGASRQLIASFLFVSEPRSCTSVCCQTQSALWIPELHIGGSFKIFVVFSDTIYYVVGPNRGQ